METPSPTPPRKGEGDSEDQATHRPSRAERFQDGVATVDQVGRLIGNGDPLPYPSPQGGARVSDKGGAPSVPGGTHQVPGDDGRSVGGGFWESTPPALHLPTGAWW